MDDISDNEAQIRYMQKFNENNYYSQLNTGEGTSNNSYEDHHRITNDLHTINRTFDDCRLANQRDGAIRKESSLFWNPENKCFEVRHYYVPKFREKNFRRDEYYQKITNINDQLVRSTGFRNNPRYSYVDPKFKAKFKKYKAVSFNPEVQVIYMIKKRSNNEVHLKGVEVLNKEQDQQMRNYIMRATYSKKKTLLY